LTVGLAGFAMIGGAAEAVSTTLYTYSTRLMLLFYVVVFAVVVDVHHSHVRNTSLSLNRQLLVLQMLMNICALDKRNSSARTTFTRSRKPLLKPEVIILPPTL
jgi:uncharacterized membrane protein